MKITRIGLDRLRLPLDPPFLAAWDPVPRSHVDATLVRVETDEGLVGVGSGDTMAGFEAFEDLFVGTDPLQMMRHVRTIESVGFHAGRFWPLEAALWDLVGQVHGAPVSVLFGNVATRVPAYASTGELKEPGARAESALAAREAGFRVMKIRVDPGRARPAAAPPVHPAHVDQRHRSAGQPPGRRGRGGRAVPRVPLRPGRLDRRAP